MLQRNSWSGGAASLSQWPSFYVGCGLALGGALLLGAGVAAYPGLATTTAMIGGVVLVAMGAWRYLSFRLAFPIWIAIGLYIAVGTIGSLFLLFMIHGATVADLHGASPLLLRFPQDLIYPTARIYFLSAAGTLAGAYLYFIVTGRQVDEAVQLSQLRFVASGVTSMLVLTGVAIAVLMLGLTHGVDTLISRGAYLRGRSASHSLEGLGRILGVASTLVAGYVWASSRSRLHRLAAGGVLVLWMTVFFSLASRELAVGVAGFTIGAFLGRGSSRRGRIVMLLAPAVIVLAFALPLYLRGSSEHGLIPYLGTLAGTDPRAQFPSLLGLTMNLFGTYVNTGMPAYLEPHLPINDLWISINPAPGEAAGWYRVAARHLVNAITPYSALGELFNYGWAILIGYCVAMGAVLAHASVTARRLIQSGHRLYGLAVVGIAILVPIMSLQYSLRTVSRLLYYAMALLFVGYLAPRVRRRVGSKPRDH